MPTWLGDCVMATPTLRALRGLYPEAEVVGVVRPAVRPALEGVPWVDLWVDRSRDVPPPEDVPGESIGVLLPNSFRSAWEMWKVPGVERIVGYSRDWRWPLLTDRLKPERDGSGRYVPTPAVDYYLRIAEYLGADVTDRRLELRPTPSGESNARAAITASGIESGRVARSPLVLIAPGANFGDAKKWFPERFAEVAARLSKEYQATIAMTGTPAEVPILQAVRHAADELGVKVFDLSAAGLSLAGLVAMVGRASVLICNDSGTRHIAAAVGTPVVTIFGPTDPRRTLLEFDADHHVVARVPCHPCQQKKCPLTGTPDELICMRSVTAGEVAEVAGGVLASASTSTSREE